MSHDELTRNGTVRYVYSDDQELLAMVVYSDCASTGVQFVTPDELSQQVAVISHPEGHLIPRHVHVLQERPGTQRTQEVLVLRKGRLEVEFYDSSKKLSGRDVVSAGDVLILIAGGHGFRVIEDVDMVEVKQGPYSGHGADKELF